MGGRIIREVMRRRKMTEAIWRHMDSNFITRGSVGGEFQRWVDDGKIETVVKTRDHFGIGGSVLGELTHEDGEGGNIRVALLNNNGADDQERTLIGEVGPGEVRVLTVFEDRDLIVGHLGVDSSVLRKG